MCQKEKIFYNSSNWKRFFCLKIFAMPGLTRVQTTLIKCEFFGKTDGADERRRL
jgi:hypothetical protein